MSSLSLCLSRWNNFKFDKKISKENQNVHTLIFLVFLLKTPAGHWNLSPEVGIKIDSQHAVKKMLGLAEK